MCGHGIESAVGGLGGNFGARKKETSVKEDSFEILVSTSKIIFEQAKMQSNEPILLRTSVVHAK